MDPLGNRTERTYDAVSQLIAVKDPKGAVTRFAYDALDRLISTTDPLGGVTSFTYDPNGNLLTVTDARGNTTTHTYDGRNRLATRTDPLGRVETFTYDFNGNLKTATDRKGQVTAHTYDPQDRRIRSDYADGTSVTYEYDPTGKLLTATDSQTGTITRSYDALDRLVGEGTPQGAITYTYDPASRRQGMQVNGLVPVAYAYDANSRLTQVQQGTQTANLTYDAADRRTTLTLPNGVTTAYVYDAASRLIGQTYTGPGGPLGTLTYAYDGTGNRIATGGTWARTGIPQGVPTGTYDAANQQLAFGPITQTFDANGNLLTQTDASGTTTYTWDARNRLIGISGPSVTASFAYDALGRRISKTINGQTTTFHYDGLDIIQESGGAGEASYIRTLAIDEALTRSNPTGTVAYLTDTLGSTLALTDASGSPATEYTYEPFGTTQVSGPSSPNPFQFTGRERDETGLYFYRARYYDSQRGRFVRENPIGVGGADPNRYAYVDSVGKPLEANLYAYALNSPTNFTDPYGLQAVPLPAPGFPLIPPPAAFPGTRENAELVRATSEALKRIGGAISDVAGSIPPPRCVAQYLADIARCVGKGICPPIDEEKTVSCFKRAANNYRACVRGWPRPHGDVYPP
jgi:RHS repeat-associated protein